MNFLLSQSLTLAQCLLNLLRHLVFASERQLVDFLMDRHLFFPASPWWVTNPDDTPL
jgi:hypothetical protein